MEDLVLVRVTKMGTEIFSGHLVVAGGELRPSRSAYSGSLAALPVAVKNAIASMAGSGKKAASAEDYEIYATLYE